MTRTKATPFEYFLHVDDDGYEHRLDAELPGQSMRVVVKGGTEFVKLWDSDAHHPIPPGKGWFACVEDRDDTHTIWQRRARRS